MTEDDSIGDMLCLFTDILAAYSEPPSSLCKIRKSDSTSQFDTMLSASTSIETNITHNILFLQYYSSLINDADTALQQSCLLDIQHTQGHPNLQLIHYNSIQKQTTNMLILK